MTNKERLKKLAQTPGASMSDSDRRFIVRQSEILSVEFTPREKCSDCYSDQAVILYRKVTEGEQAERRYILKSSIDIIWRGKRVNNTTLTDAMAEAMIADGVTVHLFAKTK